MSMRVRRTVVRSAICLAALGVSGCRSRPPDGPPAPALPYVHRPLEFRFDVGDQVEISVWKEEELKTLQRVLPDGTISPSLLDPIRVGGRSIHEVRETLAARYKEYLKDPIISLRVLEIQSERIFVLGEVRSPQAIAVHSPTTLLQAIAQAGGFLEEVADKMVVRIIRPQPGCAVPQIFTANADAIIAGRSPPIQLAPGDVVYVHPTSLAAWSRSLQQAFLPLGLLLAPVGSATSSILAVRALR